MVGGDQVGDHGLGLRFGFGREVFLRVDLADGVAEAGVNEADAALPARALLGNAGQDVADEAKLFLGKSVGQEPQRKPR